MCCDEKDMTERKLGPPGALSRTRGRRLSCAQTMTRKEVFNTSSSPHNPRTRLLKRDSISAASPACSHLSVGSNDSGPAPSPAKRSTNDYHMDTFQWKSPPCVAGEISDLD